MGWLRRWSSASPEIRGAGKNTLSESLKDLFNERNTLLIEGDDYHKWERGHERWQDYTHLNPKANHLSLMAMHTLQLSRGLSVLQRPYDHGSGVFGQPKELKFSKTVIVQGLHTFYLRGLRQTIDLRSSSIPTP